MSYDTEQESFWAGKFGTNYIDRNCGEDLLASNLNFFSKALKQTKKITSCIELGANIGMNLKALKLLYPGLNIDAVEINKQACLELEKVVGKTHTFNKSIFDFNSKLKYDFVLIKGVLIHINPDRISNVYKKLYQLSNRYILIAEYYNPSPVTISYRGHNDRLFKRDFAGEFLNKFPNLNLVDYGFIYHRDQNFPQDDITWFLIEKL
tara:strand:- start:29127 stop:29747 length:621 start_codon:yes stop_codon:yes gene_type:complete